jgi:hypothetical protein
LSAFGECPDHNRERLEREFAFVKNLDPTRPIIVSRSNNATPSWPIGKPRADIVGASIYKRVTDNYITGRTFEYPIPPWFYSFLAGATELTTDRNTFIHELQMEPWLPNNVEYDMRDAPTDVLYETFGPDRVASRLHYGIDTGMRAIDLWGVEWWYHMKENRDDPAVWNIAKNQIQSIAN